MRDYREDSGQATTEVELWRYSFRRLRWDATLGDYAGMLQPEAAVGNHRQEELPFLEIRKYVPGTLQWETTMGSNGGRPGPFALPTLELDAYTCGATMVSYAGNCNGKP